MSRKEEKELLAAGKRIFLTHFPNPERVGCPDSGTLRTMALDSLRLSLPEREMWLDHMTCCSPCFGEYYSHLQRARFRKRVAILALCAVFIGATGLAVWFGTQRRSFPQRNGTIAQNSPPRSTEPGNTSIQQGSSVAPVQAALLDLRNLGVTRGAENNKTKNEPLTLPRGSLDLSIYLPIGSDDGRYELQVKRGGEVTVLEAKGEAKTRHHITGFETNLNTSQLPPGKYLLRIRKLDSAWDQYPILVK